MKRHLKDYFIPHKENGFAPRFFRTKTAAIFSVAILLIFAFSIGISRTRPYIDFLASLYPSVLVTYTNEGRALTDDTSMLVINPLLKEAARLKAEDMATHGYFSHIGPDNKTPWYWFDRVGYSFKYAGENLAVNFTDSREVYEAWLASPAHRENLLNPRFMEIGIATAEGIYEGKSAIFVVQLFGTPADRPLNADTRARIGTFAKSHGDTPALTSLSIPEVGEEAVAGSFEQAERVTALQAAIASPHTSTQWFYLLLMAAIAAAIGLAVFVEFKLLHPSVWINGSVLLLVIALILAANDYLSLTGHAIL